MESIWGNARAYALGDKTNDDEMDNLTTLECIG